MSIIIFPPGVNAAKPKKPALPAGYENGPEFPNSLNLHSPAQ